MQFNRSDLYFICCLEPCYSSAAATNTTTGDNDDVVGIVPVAQKGEIAEAKWVPFQEYKDMVFDEKDGHPMMQRVITLYEKEEKNGYIERTVVNSIVPGRKPSPIYHAPL
jgi:hypothetical protein